MPRAPDSGSRWNAERSIHRITAFHPELDDAISLLRRELDERTQPEPLR